MPIFAHCQQKTASMRTKTRTSRSKQTLRDVSYKGAPTGTVKAAHAADAPAAPSANGTTDNIHH